MASPSPELIHALGQAAQRLRMGAQYSWGHHGACNCGNLVQSLTGFTSNEIRRFAQFGAGEWTELAREYCPQSGAPLQLLFSALERAGLTPTDIHHLEYLSDPSVLRALPGGMRWLKHNRREDAILYFETFADQLDQLRKKRQALTYNRNRIRSSAVPQPALLQPA